MSKPTRRFSIDARTILSLGRDSIKDHVTAVVELVKNSYDAGASVVQIELDVHNTDSLGGLIRISDNGHGMTEKDVEAKWLRIGFSEKLVSRTVGDRRRLGEKGVGRLSADRLGSHLQLRSQAKSQAAIGIEVDWSKFEAAGRDLHTIEIAQLDQVVFFVPQPNKVVKNKIVPTPIPQSLNSSRSTSGCELLITRLRQTWKTSDISRLRDELSHLINPFNSLGDFQIRIKNDLNPDLSGLVTPPSIAEGQIEGTFTFKGNQVTIKHQTADQKQKGNQKITEKIPLDAFCNFSPKDRALQADIGDFECRFRLYSVNKEELASSDTKGRVKTFLEANSGVRVYRDGVRVLPYGDPKRTEGDWLGLAKRKAEGRAAISRGDWRIESNRIVGAVSIERDSNFDLLDAASREGLVSNDAFVALRNLVLISIRYLERKYQTYRKDKDINNSVEGGRIQPQKVIRAFNAQIKELGATLQDLEKTLPKSQSEKVTQIRKEIVNQERKFQNLRKGLSAYVDQALTFRGLATLGIAHASFGHEIQISASQLIGTVSGAQLLLGREPVNIPKAKIELENAIVHAERISTWGSYTLTRVNAEMRELTDDVNVKEELKKLVNDLQSFFNSSSILLRCGKMSDVSASLVQMDLESLVVNFLTNAYDFVKNSKGKREVRLDLQNGVRNGKAGFWIRVADSGPGVPDHMREDIWSPLFTTKRDESQRPYGTGLGLSIVDAIVIDLGGERSVSNDTDLGGALFSVWIPLNETK